MKIDRVIDMESEFSQLQQHIKDKSPATIKTYIQNYKKVRDKIGQELKEVPLEDLILHIGQMSESYASQKAFANVWSICNFQMKGLETHPSYIKYCNHLVEQAELQMRAKHKEIKSDIIPESKLIEHELKLFSNKEFDKYVCSFIVRNCYCRNKDLDITLVKNYTDTNDTDNFIIVQDDKVFILRQNYKTFKTYGKIVTMFTEPDFVFSCNQLPINEKLFPGADNTSKLQNRLKHALYTNEVGYLNTKIEQISKSGDLAELRVVAQRRGSALENLVTDYNLDF